jgi:hypothetical protein
MRRVALALVAVLCLAGCHQSSGRRSGSTSTTSTTVAAASDSADAQSLLLTLSDLPAGWRTNASADPQADAKLAAAMLACLKETDVDVFDAAGKHTSRAHAPAFGSPDGLSITDEVMISRSDARSAASLAVVQRPAFSGCLAAFVTNTFKTTLAGDPSAAGATVGEVKVETLAPPAGADSVAYRVTVPVRLNGQSRVLSFDDVFLRHGRAMAVLSLNGTGGPFPGDVANHVIAAQGARLANSLRGGDR